MQRRLLLLAWSLLPLACGAPAQDAAPGTLTGACLDDGCFDGLQCISNACVDLGGSTGPDVDSTTGPSAGAGSTTDGTSAGPTTGAGSSDTVDPDPTTDPTSGSSDPTVDPTDPTTDPTGDDGTTGGTTDGGESSSETGDDTTDPTAGPLVCEPEVGDIACLTCVKESCCDDLAACVEDGNDQSGCACAHACVVEGNDWLACATGCGLNPPPAGSPAIPLGTCIFSTCPECL